MRTINPDRIDHKSMGFAALLITVGVIWLLRNLNLISTDGVNVALSLWPLILIAIGADLLLRKEYPHTSIVVTISIAVLVVLAALLAPRLGIGVLPTNTNTYTEALGEAQSAIINLYPSVGRVDIHAFETGDILFKATATTIGDVFFNVDGAHQRTIDFGQKEVSTTGWYGPDRELAWDIALTPNIPLNMTINTGVGGATLDFSKLNLTTLQLTAGVGNVDLILPPQENSYQVTVTRGVGDLDVHIHKNADMDVTISDGIGDVVIELPDDAAVRVMITSGFGETHFPSWLERLDAGTGDNEQIWQSSHFETAARQITLNIDKGLGNLVIR